MTVLAAVLIVADVVFVAALAKLNGRLTEEEKRGI